MRSLLILGVTAVAIVALFHDSITHAVAGDPLLREAHVLAPAPVLHFAPDENLERLDEQQLRRARSRIDISMYSFTDRKLTAVLAELAARGVVVRLYRDQEQFRHEQLFSRGRGLSTTAMLRQIPNIHIRVKGGSPRNLMHQKDYCLDGKRLRDGSANWSPGSEKRQDNSLWFSSDPRQVAAYERKFDEMWNRASNLVVQ
ncbi:MAG: phospholipase D-like domain-containing protein [Bryobacteraceae bacterium]